MAPKTPSAIRDIPLAPQLAQVLLEQLSRAARIAGLEGGDWPPLRFHDLRHTFASHLIIDLALGCRSGQPHPRALPRDDDPHLFDDARHAADIRARMAQSAFARLLTESDLGPRDASVIAFPPPRHYLTEP